MLRSECSRRLYLGTWQFGGQFGPTDPRHIRDLLGFALEQGIRHFDTAAAYGEGAVESILGDVLTAECTVVTKIPAVRKPSLANAGSVLEYYPHDWIRRQAECSLTRLRRDCLDVLLLHNWSRDWITGSLFPLEALEHLKAEKTVRHIGLSLPNGYAAHISDELLSRVDVLEAPFNIVENWILSDLARIMGAGKELLLRSIFLHGILLMDERRRREVPPHDVRFHRIREAGPVETHTAHALLADAWAFGTSLVIGMTKRAHIVANLQTLHDAELSRDQSSCSEE